MKLRLLAVPVLVTVAMLTSACGSDDTASDASTANLCDSVTKAEVEKAIGGAVKAPFSPTPEPTPSSALGSETNPNYCAYEIANTAKDGQGGFVLQAIKTNKTFADFKKENAAQLKECTISKTAPAGTDSLYGVCTSTQAKSLVMVAQQDDILVTCSGGTTPKNFAQQQKPILSLCTTTVKELLAL